MKNNKKMMATENKAKAVKSINMQSRFLVWKFHKIQEAREILANNKGLGIVEIALIIVVIVALAFLFKEKITAVLNDILSKVDANGLSDKITN